MGPARCTFSLTRRFSSSLITSSLPPARGFLNILLAFRKGSQRASAGRDWLSDVPGPGSPAGARRGDRDDLGELWFLRGGPVTTVMGWVVEAYPDRGQVHLADRPAFHNDLGPTRFDVAHPRGLNPHYGLRPTKNRDHATGVIIVQGEGILAGRQSRGTPASY